MCQYNIIDRQTYSLYNTDFMQCEVINSCSRQPKHNSAIYYRKASSRGAYGHDPFSSVFEEHRLDSTATYIITALFILNIMSLYYLILWNQVDILQKHFKKDHVHMRLWTRFYGMCTFIFYYFFLVILY